MRGDRREEDRSEVLAADVCQFGSQLGWCHVIYCRTWRAVHMHLHVQPLLFLGNLPVSSDGGTDFDQDQALTLHAHTDHNSFRSLQETAE